MSWRKLLPRRKEVDDDYLIFIDTYLCNALSILVILFMHRLII